ncbi:MAG TPA: HDOD domain-containing protein [Dissulfurispiraceae bacterium]|nr:HDOD domain-containing protein [Dissulfurispiraceae bacterium]
MQKITRLPTIPVVAHEILSMPDNDLVSLDTLENIVSKDPAISAKIIGLSNAAFFGYHMPHANVAGAIQKIGFTNVKNIALGISLMTIFGKKPLKTDCDYDRIYRHSIATGFVTLRLGGNLNIRPGDDLFLSGMLHDIGLLLLNSYFPDLYTKSAKAAQECKNLLEAESLVLGFTHADIGAWIGDTWGLSETINEVIMHHHTPSHARKYKRTVALVHLADHITCKRFSCMSEQNVHCPLDPMAFSLLDMPEKNLDDIESGIPDNLFKDGIFES